MNERRLPLPSRLKRLVADGVWPTTSEAANHQNVQPLASLGRIQAVAPGEVGLVLYPPPFQSVADDLAEQQDDRWSFWSEFGALDELAPTLALIIGDFGLGSDAPILLDYRNGVAPRVLGLEWRQPQNTWVVLAETFDEFADQLGLSP